MKIPAEALVGTTTDQLKPGDFALTEYGYWVHATTHPQDGSTLLSHLAQTSEGTTDRIGNAYKPGKHQALRVAAPYSLIARIELSETSRDFPQPSSLILCDVPRIYSIRTENYEELWIWSSMSGESISEYPRLNSSNPAALKKWSMHLKHPDGQVDSEPLFIVEKIKATEIA